MTWILIVVILVLVGFLLDRELYFYEGIHLGPRVQAWLYDRWSKKYDQGKHASQVQDAEMLAVPLLEALQTAGVLKPFVLDFATGTGRLSAALLSQSAFDGHVVALDLSQGMLEQAASKLSQHQDRVEFVRHLALPLPFPDAAFDVVCALEVLELFPAMDEPLNELRRVLRPDGILLTSRGTEESGRKRVVKSQAEFTALLGSYGFERIQITKWWKLFDRVIARKNGSSHPVKARELSKILCCEACGRTQWQKKAGLWKCQDCGKEVPVTKEGILLN